MDEKNNVVTIEVDEYDSLVETSTKYEILTKSMLKSAQLAFDRKSLRFDDELICTLLKGMLDFHYDVKLEALLREREKSLREDTLCKAEPDSTTIKV